MVGVSGGGVVGHTGQSGVEGGSDSIDIGSEENRITHYYAGNIVYSYPIITICINPLS